MNLLDRLFRRGRYEPGHGRHPGQRSHYQGHEQASREHEHHGRHAAHAGGGHGHHGATTAASMGATGATTTSGTHTHDPLSPRPG
jgi:hypothetical protein